MAPLEIENPRGRRFRRMLFGGAVVVPLLLLALSGCATHQGQIAQPTIDNPYNNLELFKGPGAVPNVANDKGVVPQGLDQFLGTTGEEAADMKAVAQVQDSTTAILQRSLDSAKAQLQDLLDRGSLDKERIKQLRERVAILDNSLNTFMEDIVGMPRITPIHTPS